MDDQEFIRQVIKETHQATVNEAFKALKKHRMLKTGKDSAFTRTEKLLYNYNRFKVLVQNKFRQIEDIERYGLGERSKDIIIMTIRGSSTTTPEEDKIQEIRESIEKITGYINLIDAALNNILNDPYFNLIRMKYFEGLSQEEIACEFEVDVSTITRNKNRLIDTMKIFLFPDDSIIELFD